MNIQELKKLKSETGASLSDCKKALRYGSSFEEAVQLAKQFATERERCEGLQEEMLQRDRNENHRAAEEKRTKINDLCIEFQLQKHEIEKLFTKTNGDWTAIRFKAASLSKEQEQERIKQNKIRRAKEVDSNWLVETSFRSSLNLGGFSKIIIEFDCVQIARISFTLDLKTGDMTALRNWHPHLLMPGEDPSDPEPLACWWIYSEDQRIEMVMHGALEDLVVNGKSIPSENIEKDYPEVINIQKEITNIVVRDLWIMKYRV